MYITTTTYAIERIIPTLSDLTMVSLGEVVKLIAGI